jgi:hypothetical protein
MKTKLYRYFTTTPTALILAKFYFLVFGFGALLSAWIPSFGEQASFPGLHQPIRAICGVFLITYITVSILYIPEKYCLFSIYLLSALRISDALVVGNPLIVFLWFGVAIICTYSIYRESFIYTIIEKRISNTKEIYYDKRE